MAKRPKKKEKALSAELNDQQERFCREYAIDLNARQAAVRAGYSAKTAQAQSSRLLTNVIISGRIQELLDARSKRTEITADTILRELLKIATADISEAYDDTGALKPFKDMPEGIRKCISGVEVNEIFDGYGDQRQVIGFTKKIKFWDKTKSLELLGKHLKLFTDRLQIGPDDGNTPTGFFIEGLEEKNEPLLVLPDPNTIEVKGEIKD